MSKTELKKPQGWTSAFNLVGKVKPNDGTFGINQSKENSSWSKSIFSKIILLILLFTQD